MKPLFIATAALAFALAGILGLNVEAAAQQTERVGNFAVTLRLPAEGLYADEESQIEFRIVDASKDDPVLGSPGVIRATIQTLITMPAMQGMPAQSEQAHAEGVPGDYGIHPVFPHGGRYSIRLEVKPPVGEPFAVSFPVDVKDADPRRPAKPRPFALELAAKPAKPISGEPVSMRLTIRDQKTGEQMKAFDVAHEKLIHLMIIRDDLGTFSHVHPDIQSDGSFTITYTFPTEGRFHLFADVAPKGRGSQVLTAEIDVKPAKGSPRPQPFVLDASRPAVSTVDGVTARLSSDPAPATRTMNTLTVTLTDATTGKPVTDLQPYLGAMGHMVLVNQDGTTYVHSHPDDALADDARNGVVSFSARFAKPGLYRCWAQFQRNGTVITTDFAVSVREGAQ